MTEKQNENPVISVIVPSKGRPDSVRALLDSIQNQDFPQDQLEIILIDDGSDPPYAIEQDNLQLVRHDKSAGAQKSRNQAIALATGKYVLMLDDDIEFIDTNFLSTLTNILDTRQEVGAAFGYKIDYFKRPDGEEKRDFPIGRLTWYSGDLVPGKSSAGPIDWGNQVYLIRRELLEKLGGYDGIYGLNGGHSFREESDLHAYVRKEGYLLWYCPDVRFYHCIVDTGGHGSNVGQRLYWFAHNHIIFLRRHIALWPFRAIGFLFDVLRYSYVQSRFKCTKEMMRGYVAGWRNALRDRGPGQNPWLEKEE